MFRLIWLRHVTFGESGILGSPYLRKYMRDDSASHTSYRSEDDPPSTCSDKIREDDVGYIIYGSEIGSTDRIEDSVDVICKSPAPL